MCPRLFCQYSSASFWTTAGPFDWFRGREEGGKREVFVYKFELCYLPLSMFQGISVCENKFHADRLLWVLDVAVAQ